MKKDKNILVVMPVKDEHKKTLEQHSQGNKFIYSSYDNVTQEMVQEANVIIGTHALLQEKVMYENLGLVITDEQHRFGVKQREALTTRGNAPHVLVMSATPIPRTLARPPSVREAGRAPRPAFPDAAFPALQLAHRHVVTLIRRCPLRKRVRPSWRSAAC